MTSVAMEVSVQGDNLTMVFIRPTSKVTVTFYTKYIKEIKNKDKIVHENVDKGFN